MKQWRIQDFPSGGRRAVGGCRPLMWALFGKNVCKNERIGSCWWWCWWGGGGRTPASPPGSANAKCPKICPSVIPHVEKYISYFSVFVSNSELFFLFYKILHILALCFSNKNLHGLLLLGNPSPRRDAPYNIVHVLLFLACSLSHALLSHFRVLTSSCSLSTCRSSITSCCRKKKVKYPHFIPININDVQIIALFHSYVAIGILIAFSSLVSGILRENVLFQF